MKRQRIKELWNSFSKAVGLDQVSKLQRDEMEKSFYAGANSLYDLLVFGSSAGEGVQQQDLDMMREIHQEFLDYAAQLRRNLNVRT